MSTKSARELPNEPSVFQVPLNVQPQQPWAKHPNPTAWFNQGLNAESWTLQASQQNKIRNAIKQEKIVSSVGPSESSR